MIRNLGLILFLLFINGVFHCLSIHDIHFEAYSGDLMIISLTEPISWFNDNLLEVNPSKCSVISSSRSKLPYLFDYTLNSSCVLCHIICKWHIMKNWKVNLRDT